MATSEELHEVADKNGDKMTLQRYNGRYYSTFDYEIEKVLKSVRRLKRRKGDVILSSYPRSGTHWVHSILNMILKGNNELPESVNFLEYPTYCDIQDERPLSNRLEATHLHYDEIPQKFLANGGKIISVIRNPKDVAVSWFHYASMFKSAKYTGCWGGFLDLFMKGEVLNGYWFEHVKHWEETARKHPKQILQIHYEKLKKDTLSTVKKIADFLEMPVKEELAASIIAKNAIDKMKTNDDKIHKDYWKCHSKTGKSPVYRKGGTGGWKNYFTVQQNEDFDDLFKREMKTSKLNISFE